jgi:hypothetical protein
MKLKAICIRCRANIDRRNKSSYNREEALKMMTIARPALGKRIFVGVYLENGAVKTGMRREVHQPAKRTLAISQVRILPSLPNN